MRYVIIGKNLEVTDGLRETTESKLSRLEKYFAPETEARITLGTEAGQQIIEVTIPTKIGLIRAERSGYDLYNSIDDVVEVIEKQIKKYKNKLVDKKQSVTPFSQNFLEEKYAEEDDDQLRIVKTKSFALKPMDPEEACLQMEMLGHDFFVFLNSESNEVNVVYKRKNSSYGLIEPRFDGEED